MDKYAIQPYVYVRSNSAMKQNISNIKLVSYNLVNKAKFALYQ